MKMVIFFPINSTCYLKQQQNIKSQTRMKTSHIYIYIYLLGYIQKLIQIPASFLCAICSASIFSFTVYKLSWPSQMLVEAISCSYSVLYFQYKKWADKLWHRHRTKLAEVLLTGHSQMLYRPTPPKTTPFHRVNKNLL